MIQNLSSKKQEAYTETDTIIRLLNGTVRKSQLRLFVDLAGRFDWHKLSRITESESLAAAESAITACMLGERFVRAAKRSTTITSEFMQFRKHAERALIETGTLGSLSRKKGRVIGVAIGTSEQANAIAYAIYAMKQNKRSD
jgi:hypothetical protein